MPSRPHLPCLRCGYFPIHVLGCCKDCTHMDPDMAKRITDDARRYRTKSGTPRRRADRPKFVKANQ